MSRRSSWSNRWSVRNIALGFLRTSLILALGLALSDPKLLRHSDQVNVWYCLDVSGSIPPKQRQKAESFIEQSAAAMQSDDRAGLIVFGKQPSLEVSLTAKLEALNIKSMVNPHSTNIHDALLLALGRLPQQGKNKIVVLSDGNENRRLSRDMANLAGSLGVEIYPVPLATWFGKNEAFVASLNTPADVALATPFEIRLVVVSSVKNSAELVLLRNSNLLTRQSLELKAGANVITLADTLAAPGLYLYRAVINVADDIYFQNNEGLSFTNATRKTRILFHGQI